MAKRRLTAHRSLLIKEAKSYYLKISGGLSTLQEFKFPNMASAGLAFRGDFELITQLGGFYFR